MHVTIVIRARMYIRVVYNWFGLFSGKRSIVSCLL